MPRKVAPRRVARLQTRFLREEGATAQEIRRWRPLLTAQIRHESNFTEGVGSGAGARDIAQFMPTTAPGYGVKLGDGRIADDLRGQVRYMLPLLRKHGEEDALRAYNAGPGAIEQSRGFDETNGYVRRVLGSAGEYRGIGPSGGGDRGPLADRMRQRGRQRGRSPAAGFDPGTVQVLSEASGAQAPPQSLVPQMGLPAPVTDARAALALPEGYQPPAGGAGPAAQPSLADQLRQQAQAVEFGEPGGGNIQRNDSRGGRRAGGREPVRVGKVKLAPTADRAGVSTSRRVRSFVADVAGEAGVGTLTIETGTNHSRLTVNGNVSNHWDGNAADVPAAGRRLIELGQAALIRAGMPEREARKQTGGLFNVGGWQIIFNTQEGGDHTDHLHAGWRGR